MQTLDQTTRSSGLVPENAKGTPAASMPFRVVLTETSNKYLAPRLPLTGLVDIIERDIYGAVMKVVFLPDPEPGKGTSWVECRDARFEFGTRV